MKIIFALTLIVLAALIAGCSSNEEQSKMSVSTGHEEEYYTCPMHPSVRSDKPGACPVCGMALVKKTALVEVAPSELADLAALSLSPTQRVLANVTTTPARTQRLIKEIIAAGVVESAEPRQATVSARFRGRIEKLFVAFTGEQVQKGQPLFELYSPDLISAQQEYLLALNGTNIASSAGNPGVLPGGILQSARERLRTHFGMTDQQIRDLEQTGKTSTTISFHAPIAGTVLRKSVLEGQYVDEGTRLYELADLSIVWIYLDIYEKDLSHVRVGQEVQLSTEANPGRRFSGAVTFVDPVLNPDTRTVRVRIDARNAQNLLKPGMFVAGRIEHLLEPSLVVPRSAVLSTGKQDVVWIEVRENTFEPRSVTRGITTHEYVQILNGLDEGDRVVSTGGYLIDSESSLQMPTSADPHAGHSMGSAAEETEQTMNEVVLRVKGEYSPNTIRAKSGSPLHLKIYRDEELRCTEEILFTEFNIRAHLTAFDTTTVEFTPQGKGTYTFSCGMDMVHGTLIVE